MPLVINVCKAGCKHNPWNSTYLFTSAHSGLLHALTKTYHEANLSTSWVPLLHDKGIRLTMVAKWITGLHMGPMRRLKTPD